MSSEEIKTEMIEEAFDEESFDEMDKDIVKSKKGEDTYNGMTRKEVVTLLLNWAPRVRVEDLLDEKKVHLKQLVVLYEKHCKEGDKKNDDDDDDDLVSIDSDDETTMHECPSSGKRYRGKDLLNMWEGEINAKVGRIQTPKAKKGGKAKVKREDSDDDDTDTVKEEEIETTKKKPGRKPSTQTVWEKFTFGNRINLGAKVYKAYCEKNNIDMTTPVKFHTPFGDVFKCLDHGKFEDKPFWSKLPHSEMEEGTYF